ncbi:TonB-dependent receptor [Zunongwangia sp.]|uniref:TonB-dependent receptor n=1 Tax=Zunongwangia sp. TaxID=1965325 RepID=UPI003AA8950B
MRFVVFYLLFQMVFINLYSQQSKIDGQLINARTQQPIDNAKIQLLGHSEYIHSDLNGYFKLKIPERAEGEFLLKIAKEGFKDLKLPLVIYANKSIDLEVLLMNPDIAEKQLQMGSIVLSENALNQENIDVGFIPGLLNANRNNFLNAAAFDFSQTFFKARGYDSEYGVILINGLAFNKLFDGRPQWSNWGGLNDVQRNQEFVYGVGATDQHFGQVAGLTNFTMRASKFSKGSKISISAANRSYRGRLMATYHSGEIDNAWYYSVSASKRWGEEGFTNGTLYNSYGIFFAAEKTINKKHSINLTAFYTPTTRGKSAAITDEVFELKGRRYNSYWGLQNGKIRNARLREIKEPIVMLNHYWKLTSKTSLQNNLGYQFGKISNSRLDYGGTNLINFGDDIFYEGGGRNPDPAYYQNLPSYFLRFQGNENYEAAYKIQQEFIEDGQLNWQSLYEANQSQKNSNSNAIYALAADIANNRKWLFSSQFQHTISPIFSANAALSYTHLLNKNYAEIQDLLGGSEFLDINFFAEETETIPLEEAVQNNLKNPNKLVREGQVYKYHYNLNAAQAKAFYQLQFRKNKLSAFLGGSVSYTDYIRDGKFQSGLYQNQSLGESQQLDFTNLGFKGGITYQFNGKHAAILNSSYQTRAPNLQNSFSNPRQNNFIVQNLESEHIFSIDGSYQFRSSNFNAKLTGYFSNFSKLTDVSFYYADGLSGLGRNTTTAFVQEVLTNIEKQHIGIEFGADYQLTASLKLKTVVAIGQHIFANNPNLYVTSDSFSGSIDYGTSKLKNYRLANGPQHAAQVGFEYRDPDYWWFGATANYFSHAFINSSPLIRTDNFATAPDGLPLANYNPEVAKRLLQQEQLPDYWLVNLIGGKSWKIKQKYLGLFVSLNNILDTVFKTGGYEQSRNANYTSLKEDREREMPIFGNKYWFGRGITYFTNFYIRF